MLTIRNVIPVISMGWGNRHQIVIKMNILDLFFPLLKEVRSHTFVPSVSFYTPRGPLFPPLWWSAPPQCSTCVFIQVCSLSTYIISILVISISIFWRFSLQPCFLSTSISSKGIENRPLTTPCSGNKSLRWCNQRYLRPKIAGVLHAGVILCCRYWHFLLAGEVLKQPLVSR